MFVTGFPEEIPYCRLVVLASDTYVDPLLVNQEFDSFPFGVEFPF